MPVTPDPIAAAAEPVRAPNRSWRADLGRTTICLGISVGGLFLLWAVLQMKESGAVAAVGLTGVVIVSIVGSWFAAATIFRAFTANHPTRARGARGPAPPRGPLRDALPRRRGRAPIERGGSRKAAATLRSGSPSSSPAGERVVPRGRRDRDRGCHAYRSRDAVAGECPHRARIRGGLRRVDDGLARPRGAPGAPSVGTPRRAR